MRNVLGIMSTLFVVIFKLGTHLSTCFATADISCKVGKELGIFNTWVLSSSLLHSVIINNNIYYNYYACFFHLFLPVLKAI